MRYPAFVAEIGRDDNRPKIQAGIYTGYATALFFGALAWYAARHGLLPLGPALGLLGLKVVTNTLSWIGLRARVLHLELAALNIAADLFVMTGAIYLTGGPLSPLLPIYFIEASVMALLTNVGLTIVTIVASYGLFTAMCALVYAGVLPLLPTPLEHVGSLTAGYLVSVLLAFGVVLVVPGVYVALIVQRLRANEAALEERARELVEASREKSQFIANVTHELRTPLHGILGLGDLIREGIYGPVTEAQREGVDGIQESARNLLELIDALLLLARSEAAKLDVVVAEVSVEEVVGSVAASGRWMRGKKDLALEVAVPPDLPTIRTDRAKLVQILINLLANAIKFTPEGGRVTIEARAAPGGSVEIAVADTGIGIPAREIGRIFEAFHQVDGSASRAYGGAGLGLSLVKKLSTLIEAKVTVESVEDRGSTFTVRLPARIEPKSGSVRPNRDTLPRPPTS